ncbi:MAG: tRNA pseudouridine(13) synthase TruD [Candidatus Micrarchaeaceae archaeon]
MLNLSRAEGTGGTVKSGPSAFIVKEITSNGIVLEPGRHYTPEELGEKPSPEGKFTRFVLQKEGWNTVQSLVAIAKKAGRGKKSIGYAGVKDRTSISVQLASIFGTNPEQILALRMKDISINGAWKCSSPVEMGSNIGNSFEVIIENVSRPRNAQKVIEELGGRVPNYFDRQRFGSRLNNADIGIAILKGDFEKAAMLMLTYTGGETNGFAVSARSRLRDEMDFKAALSYFPAYLKDELYLIRHLSKYKGDFAGAMRRLPRGVLLMYIHAVQSLLFNMEVEERIKNNDFESGISCGGNRYGFPDIGAISEGSSGFQAIPLVGYETKDRCISEYGKKSMDRIGIAKELFMIKGMPELSMKGSYRTIFAPFKDLSVSEGEGVIKLSFSIPSGTYATVLINEITKSDNFSLGGLFHNLD